MTIWLVLTAIASMAATLGFLYMIGALRQGRHPVRAERGDLPLFFEIFHAKEQIRHEKNDF